MERRQDMGKNKRHLIFIMITSLVMVFTMAVPIWADDITTTSDGTPSVTDPIVPSGTSDPSGTTGSTDPTGTQEPSTTLDETDNTETTAPKILTGWQIIDGSEYYYKNGKPVTGIRKIGSKVYSFTATGKLNTGASGKMDVKAYNYSSKTKYLILVNCSTHRVGVYKGSKANWKRLYYWKCGDGKKSTPTVKGTFKTGVYKGRKYKQKYFDSHGARCWYATRIYNGYLFHSVLYKRAKTPKKIKDGRLGAGVSHGCVRLAIGNAKWIYKNIPKKTKVIIYK